MPSAPSTALFDALAAVEFRNGEDAGGLTLASDELFFDRIHPVGAGQQYFYMEPDNVSCTKCYWLDGGSHAYLFRALKPGPPPAPTPAGSINPGFYGGDAPGNGMRSAVPLGGIGAGSVELRADGTLHEWTIHNAGPQGAAKIGQYENCGFAATVNGVTRLLQTHPQRASPGIKSAGVAAMRYRGSFPVSRLDILEPALSNAGTLRLDLFGYSHLAAHDMSASSRPAVAFTLSIANSGPTAANVSFAMLLPLLVETDQCRHGEALPRAAQPYGLVGTAVACAQACATHEACRSWVWNATAQNCTLQADAPLNQYLQGVSSGLRGEWHDEGDCLMLRRPGLGPMHGNVSLCGAADGETDVPSGVARTSDDPTALLESLMGDSRRPSGAGVHGGRAVRVLVPPQSNRTLTLTLGWRFPHRDMHNYDNEVSFAPYANLYASRFDSSDAAAWADAPAASRAAALTGVLSDVAALHEPFVRSTLPPWLQDLLVNSLSHSRNSMWWQDCPNCTASADPRLRGAGFWRQFEAFDWADVDSIHNDGERHVPVRRPPAPTPSALVTRDC